MSNEESSKKERSEEMEELADSISRIVLARISNMVRRSSDVSSARANDCVGGFSCDEDHRCSDFRCGEFKFPM